MKSWVRNVFVLCITIALLAPPASGFILEMIGFGATGIVKGSLVASAQSIAATGGGLFGTMLGYIGFGAAGIAKGSIAAGLQSAAASGAGLGIVGVAAVPTALTGGADLVYDGLRNQTEVLISQLDLDTYMNVISSATSESFESCKQVFEKITNFK